jgi:hypothetical protein
MTAIRGELSFVYWLSALLAGLLVVSSIIGLTFGSSGLYAAYPASLAGLIGQDIVTLGVGLPLLLAGMWLTRRGWNGGPLVWAGALFYFAYSYYFFLVGAFNALFLVYVAIVGSSLYALLALLFRLDATALMAQFTDRAPVRRTAAFFIVTGSLFAVMWGGLSIGSVASATSPDPVVHLVVAIDGAVLLPLLVVGGLKLWRHEPWGYVLGGFLLTKVTATGFTLAFTSALGMWWAGSADPSQAFLAGLFAVMAAVGLALVVPYLRSLTVQHRTAGSTSPISEPNRSAQPS